jgi:hypothetical protein
MKQEPIATSSYRDVLQSRMMSTEPPGILRDRDQVESIEKEPVIPRRLNTDIPYILPHEKVFPIQIGSELFRLSGASISSDGMLDYISCMSRHETDKPRAPSYFSQFFVCQLKENADDLNAVRTLYIDRDPVTFKDISLHLQGYHVSPKDSAHFVKLFADAQFYSCKISPFTQEVEKLMI